MADEKQDPPKPTGIEARLAELGLKAGEDGKVQIEMLTGVSGKGFAVVKGNVRGFEPDLAIRLVARGDAKPARAKA